MTFHNLRIGNGFDVHAFAENRKLILGGVEIPGCAGLDGHSDADVVTHAIMDGLLGAARLGDIGKLFPDTDDSFKDANSIELLKTVANLIKESGFEIIDIDCVIMAQKPKISGYRDDMCRCVADALSISPENVGIKATTTEKLGFVGREEGIAASAVCLCLKH